MMMVVVARAVDRDQGLVQLFLREQAAGQRGLLKHGLIHGILDERARRDFDYTAPGKLVSEPSAQGATFAQLWQL